MSEVVYAQGSTGTHQWVFKGPRLLIDAQQAKTVWAEALRAGLQTLMSNVKRDAQAAYSDVPAIQAGFAYTTQASPYPRGQLIARVDLFSVVEYPTRPHLIEAKNKPWLHFRFPDGHWVKVKQVNHPGTKGRNAIASIMDRYAPQFQAVCERAIAMMVDV